MPSKAFRVVAAWLGNSVCEISWKLVQNWLSNPQNSFTLVNDINVHLTKAFFLFVPMYWHKVEMCLFFTRQSGNGDPGQIIATSHLYGAGDQEIGRFEGYFRLREAYWWEHYYSYYSDYNIRERSYVALLTVRCPQPGQATLVKLTMPDANYKFKEMYAMTHFIWCSIHHVYYVKNQNLHSYSGKDWKLYILAKLFHLKSSVFRHAGSTNWNGKRTMIMSMIRISSASELGPLRF